MATIRKRGKKWQAQVRRQGYPPLVKTFLTKDDASRWGRSLERRIDLGEAAPPDNSEFKLLRLADLIARYEAEVSIHKRSKSAEFHFRQIARHSISKLPIAALSATTIAGYRDDRLKSVSGSTVRKELALLGHVLKLARNEWGLTQLVDPVRTVRKPSEGRGRDRRVSPEEIEIIQQGFRRMRNPVLKEAFEFALATGMRRGEVLSLDWQHVGFESKTALLPITKNGDKRVIPLSPAALDVLKRRVGKSQDSDEANIQPRSGVVFPVSPNALRLAWDRMRKISNIKDLRFHDLRHEAISRFFEMGLSMPEVALISGHKDTRMLLRYTHLRAEDIAKKIAAISRKEQ